MIVVNKNSTMSFHHQGAQCSNCQEVVQAFGMEPMPSICPNCNEPNTLGKILWSHFVVTKTVVTDLLAPGATPESTVAP